MPDIQVTRLCKYFGEKQVLKDLSFEIQEGEKVGLIGANGAGKTTLFKILTSRCDYDTGEVFLAKDKTVAALDQIPDYPADYTAEDVMRSAFSAFDRMKDELRALEKSMAQNASKSDVKRYGELLSRFEGLGGYDTDFELDRVANGLSVSNELRRRPFSLLSGGEKTRVNLARVMLMRADILLLDEPTNHLDLHSCEFLGEYLGSYKKTIVAISHDRYFLDQVASRILELEGGQILSFGGNYSVYAVEKERAREEAMKLFEAHEQEKKRLEDAAAKLHSWGTQSVKMHKHAFSIEKRIERMKAYERPPTNRSLNLKFGESEYFTEDVLKVKGLTKQYNSRVILSNLSFTVKNGDRIALIGENGAGKTTLLRLLLSQERPDSGIVRLDAGLKPGYLPQNVTFTNPSRNLIDTLIYEKNMAVQTARNRLGAFGFSGEEQLKPVSSLSGGEKSRLKLLMLMCDKINMLFLDEPTNHLDIPSREWIEDAVSAFSGTILFVSHDRYFLSRFAKRIFALENGLFTDFSGGYEDYEKNAALSECIFKEPKALPKQDTATKAHTAEREKRSIRLQVKKLESEIDKMETRLSEIDSEMEKNALDHVALGELFDEKNRLQSELCLFMDEWQRLSEKL